MLQTIEASANRYARHIVPIASCSIDFYVRVFVRVYKSPVNVKQAMTKLSYVFQVRGTHGHAITLSTNSAHVVLVLFHCQ